MDPQNALNNTDTLAARALGQRDDVSLVGYDDAVFAPALDPALTTVRQPSFDMGVAAAELLVKGARRDAGEHVEFDPQLIVRASTRAQGPSDLG